MLTGRKLIVLLIYNHKIKEHRLALAIIYLYIINIIDNLKIAGSTD